MFWTASQTQQWTKTYYTSATTTHNKEHLVRSTSETNLESATHHKFQTQSQFEPWAKVKLLQSSKIKTRQKKTQRIQRLKECKIMRRGPKFKKFGENGCSCNTPSDVAATMRSSIRCSMGCTCCSCNRSPQIS